MLIAQERPAIGTEIRHRWLWRVAGFGAALLIIELLLRPWTTASGGDPQPTGVEYRYFREGIATSHFSKDEMRRTGNPFVAGAPALLMLGDSHVEAIQVADQETMGAVLERRLRAAGQPVNVLQYGWSGASPPWYCQYGPALVRQWQPRWVVVVLNLTDITREAFDTKGVRFQFGAGNTVTLVSDPKPAKTPLESVFAEPNHWSALLYQLHFRWLLVPKPALPPVPTPAFWTSRAFASTGSDGASEAEIEAREEQVPAISARELKRVFGAERLLIAYDAVPGPQGWEHRRSLLRAACAAERVRLVEIDPAITAVESSLHRFGRGFSNSGPNAGHYNAFGHAAIAARLQSAIEDGR